MPGAGAGTRQQSPALHSHCLEGRGGFTGEHNRPPKAAYFWAWTLHQYVKGRHDVTTLGPVFNFKCVCVEAPGKWGTSPSFVPCSLNTQRAPCENVSYFVRRKRKRMGARAGGTSLAECCLKPLWSTWQVSDCCRPLGTSLSAYPPLLPLPNTHKSFKITNTSFYASLSCRMTKFSKPKVRGGASLQQSI